jgi:hypothetical protein
LGRVFQSFSASSKSLAANFANNRESKFFEELV